MRTEALPIQSLTLRSTGHLFALWYTFWGTIGALVFVSASVKRLDVPLGLFIPFVDWHLNFSVGRAPTFPGVIAQSMFFVLFCAATGWISGILTALAYNLISKHLGFQLHGLTETKPSSDAP